MPQLFDRVCRVTVGAQVGAIRAGLRVEKHRVAFRVEKTLKPEPNKCELSIYNLSREQRAQIEELSVKPDTAAKETGVPVLIEAGYKSTDASQIFLGDLRTVSSKRVGADWVTTIESGDGELAKHNPVAVSYGPQTSPDIALRAIAKALGVGEGNVAETAIKLRQSGVGTLFPRRGVLTGSAYDHMTHFARSAGLEWSIQDGAIQFVDLNKTLAGTVLKLSKTSGLIDSPQVDHKGLLTCKMLIQPNVKPGSLLVLDSATARGNYRIERATWEGDTYDIAWYITVEAKRY